MIRPSALATALLAAVVLAGCAAIGQRDALIAGRHAPTEDPARLVIVAMHNDSVSGPPRPASTRPAYGATPYASGTRAVDAMRELARDYDLAQITAWPIDALQMHCAVLRMPASMSRAQLLEQLAADPRVRLAQPMNEFSTQSVAYNDPYAALQSAFQRIDAAMAQQFSQGEGVRVAIIDTGLDSNHPDLGDRIIVQRNFVDRDAERFRRDRHGTAVAGVISASANNERGIVGVAPRAQVIALKACWEMAGESRAARCNSLTLAQALSAAIEERAQVVNLSLTGPHDELLAALVAAGRDRGILYVGAATGDAAADDFPAGVPGVIAVRMTETDGGPSGALRAPGRDVVTLVPGGSYDFVSGPSLATAHVSGVVALLVAKYRGIDRDTVYSLLHDSGQPINACVALSGLQAASPVACTRQPNQPVAER